MELGRVLDGLDAEQAAAVSSLGAPLAIVAPAGSGKTRVLTCRIARRVADGSAAAGHVLALTFTRRAAGELLDRLGALGLRTQPTVGTFHGVAWSVLRQRWADQGLRRAPELLTRPEQLLAELPEVASLRGGRRAPASDVAAEITWAHARLVAPERYESAAVRAGRRPAPGAGAVANAYAAYEKAKRTRRLVDFDDLLAVVARDMAKDGAFAEVQRWRFRHVFVDEFQDVNPLQRFLLEAWRGGRPDLCVVGDPNQAIYEWNGADAGWIRDFADHYPGSTILRLTRNYRSSPEIVDAAARVLGARRGDRDHADDGPAPEPVEAVQPAGRAPVIHAYDDEVSEAAGIAAIIRAERIPGRRWSAFGVLVRTHAQVAVIERALRTAGIPVRARGSQPILASAPILAALDAAAEHAGPGGLRNFIDELEEEGDPGPGGLGALGRQFLASDPNGSVAAFRVWLALGSPGDDGYTGGDTVDIVTFHGAKGLEWPIVVLAGLERGLVPHSSATTATARDEEVRLLHVAVTRAEQQVHLTWARRRGNVARTVSPLLARLDQLADEAAPPPRLLLARRPAAGDPALLALKAWRHAAALAAGLPEPAVCTDQALAAVARARPTTVAELAALPEIGPMAARRLGPRILAALATGP